MTDINNSSPFQVTRAKAREKKQRAMIRSTEVLLYEFSGTIQTREDL